jgi:hypothetical protein
MHLFTAKILLYLSLNVIGYFFTFISILGTPGNPDETIPGTKFLIKLTGFLMLLAWKGIPVLLFASVAAFYFQLPFTGKLCSIVALSIGLGVFLSMIAIYAVQSGNRQIR